MFVKLAKNLVSVRPLTTPAFSFGRLSDYFQKKQSNKQENEFKKQIEYLANKPQFTYIDFKQRIEDELSKLTKQIKNKFTNENKELEKANQMKKKILCAMFEQEMLSCKKLNQLKRQEIALVAQVTQDNIRDLEKEFKRYFNMHALVREMKVKHQPLPESIEELQYLYAKSGIEYEDNKYAKYKKYSRRQRIRMIDQR